METPFRYDYFDKTGSNLSIKVSYKEELIAEVFSRQKPNGIYIYKKTKKANWEEQMCAFTPLKQDETSLRAEIKSLLERQASDAVVIFVRENPWELGRELVP